MGQAPAPWLETRGKWKGSDEPHTPTSTARSSLQRWIAEAGGWQVGTLWRAPLGPTQERFLKAPSCLLPEVCIRRQQGEAPAQSFWKVLTAVSQGWDPMQGVCVHHAALRVVPIMASGWVSFLLSWSLGGLLTTGMAVLALVAVTHTAFQYLVKCRERSPPAKGRRSSQPQDLIKLNSLLWQE